MAERVYSKTTTMRRRRNIVGAVVVVGILIVITAVVASAQLVCQGCSSPPSITVITTGGTTKETDVAITGEPATMIRQVAEANGHLDLIKVDGDGSTTTQTEDLTPRDSGGRELKPVQRREAAVDATIASLVQALNEFDTTVPGRSVLAGLQSVPAGGTGPILVFSSGLDTRDPLSMSDLGFDVNPQSVVRQLRAADELPMNLKSREIIFILTPVAGSQPAPRQPEQLYVQRLLTAIVTAGGATSVEFIAGQGGRAPGSGGDAPVVAMPGAPNTIKSATTTTTDEQGRASVTTVCVIPSPLLFEPDSSRLLDANAAKGALAKCLQHKTARTTVLVEGHTSCRNQPDSDPAVALRLSAARGRRIADLLVDRLGVRRSSTHVRGWGNSKPIRKPCTDPGNRAVVVTISTPKENK